MGPPILMASLALTPRGRLLFTTTDGTFQPPEALLRRLESAFGRGSGHGLLELGAPEWGPRFHPTSATVAIVGHGIRDHQ